MTISGIASVHARGLGRWASIVAGIFALLGSFAVSAPAQAGYYPCSYGCGQSAHLLYERRYVEREYIERRYGYAGYRRHYGYYPYGGYRPYGYSPYGGYRPHYGYYPYGGYRRPYGYPYGGYYRGPYGYSPYGGYRRPFGYGYGGVGRRWPVPYLGGYERSGYEDEEPPRPPAPVLGGTGYGDDPYGDEN